MKEGKLFRNTVEGRKAFRTQLAKQLDELRRELDRLKVAALRKRAHAVGVPAYDLAKAVGRRRL
eukprot:COSAG04_NODE_588_length_12325_cov_114.087682_7_plen_64_part_00